MPSVETLWPLVIYAKERVYKNRAKMTHLERIAVRAVYATHGLAGLFFLLFSLGVGIRRYEWNHGQGWAFAVAIIIFIQLAVFTLGYADILRDPRLANIENTMFSLVLLSEIVVVISFVILLPMQAENFRYWFLFFLFFGPYILAAATYVYLKVQEVRNNPLEATNVDEPYHDGDQGIDVNRDLP